MRVVLVLALIALTGAFAYGYFDLTSKLGVAQRKLDEAEALNIKARQTLGEVTVDYASALKVTRALDHLQGQITKVRDNVGQIGNSYAVAAKVDALLIGLRNDIEAHKKQLAALPAPVAVPAFVIDIGFRQNDDTSLPLRYAGATVEMALERKTLTKRGAQLNKMVKLNPSDARLGTAEFNYAVLRSPEGMRTITLGPGKARPVGMFRPAPSSVDWDLGADGRQAIVEMLK